MTQNITAPSPAQGADANAPAPTRAATPTDMPAGKVVPPAGNTPPAPQPMTVRQAVEQINSFLSANARDLRFRLDESSGRTVITVVNPNTGEVIRQIPPEEMMAAARSLDGPGPVVVNALV